MPKRYINNFIFSLLLVLTPFGLSAQVLTPVSNESELKTAATNGGNYGLSGDITIAGNSAISIEGGNAPFSIIGQATGQPKPYAITGKGGGRLFEIKDSQAYFKKLIIASGTAAQDANDISKGGAVMISILSNPKNKGNEISFEGVTFSSNTALADTQTTGAPAYAYGGAVYIDNALSTSSLRSTFTNTLFEGNRAEAISSATAEGYGGAIYNSSTGTLTVINSSFTLNSATTSGGALYNKISSGSAIFDTVLFSSNTALAGGGAVFNEISSGTVSFNNIVFSSNSADSAGGAIYNNLSSSATLTVNNSSFKLNSTSATGEGGAIYNKGGNFKIANSEFQENSSNNGGALHAANGNNGSGKITVEKSSFKQNSAGNDGGAIYNDSSNLDIEHSQFKYNSAQGNGGAVYSAGGELKIKTGIFEGNKAVNGGAIYVSGSGENVITNGTFANNSATGRGGAIYLDNSTMTLTTHNSAYGLAFSGNADSTGSNSIHLAGASVLNLSGQISFYDKISGEAGSEINITAGNINFSAPDEYGYDFLGALKFNNSSLGIYGNVDFSSATATAEMGNSSILMQNGAINVFALGGFTDKTGNSATIDIDPLNGKADEINTKSGHGDIYISNVRILSDFDASRVMPVSNNLNITLADTKYYGPLFAYMLDVALGGKAIETTQTKELNPSVLAAPVSNNATFFNNMLISNTLMDRIGVMLSRDGRYYGSRNNYTLKNSPLKDKKTFKAGDITQKNWHAAWFTPYAAKQTINFTQNVEEADNTAIGALAGVDMPARTLGDFGLIPTIFAGYGSETQKYEIVSLEREEFIVGAMATLYKGSFLASLETHISNGEIISQMREYPADNHTDFAFTAATKAEYSLELFRNLLLSAELFSAYNLTNPRDYTTGRNAAIKAGKYHSFQTVPGVKLSSNIYGWRPYLNAAYAFNFQKNGALSGNGRELPADISVKDYRRYGAGVENTFLETYSGYVQVSGYEGGINGFSLQIGLRGYID
jgi:predicted outer membrane repeat protein